MTVSIHHAKAELRQQIRARFSAMTPGLLESASRQICSRLRQESVWQAAQAVLCFAPLADEPDIWPLVEEILVAGKTVALPRFSAVRSGYTACQVRDLSREIHVGKFQIREPAEGCPELPLARFDLILVPGVAFDKAGHRLGRGRGYYDRLLQDAPGATLCGVAFAEQWLEDIPAAAHDIRMQLVATPAGVFRCGK